jgi:NarL family two-component system response regulator LiaR
MEIIRIILAEDHSLVRQGTIILLEQTPDFKIIGQAEDGKQALDLIGQLQPDVALLDIRMPKMSGIDVVRNMKTVAHNSRALVLSAYDDDDYILAALQAGATGYILKTASPEELKDAIRSVFHGEAVLHPAIAIKVARLWANRGTNVEDSSSKLSPRELEVMKLVAQGLRNKQIADILKISIRTVEGYFYTIYTKIGVSSRIEAVLYVLSHNLVTIEGNNRSE